jgi:TolA-binding protein
LLTANPDSPYIDQLLLLAADCELKQGRSEPALAILRRLLKDYPGSPLVPLAKQKLSQLEAAPNK